MDENRPNTYHSCVDQRQPKICACFVSWYAKRGETDASDRCCRKQKADDPGERAGLSAFLEGVAIDRARIFRCAKYSRNCGGRYSPTTGNSGDNAGIRCTQTEHAGVCIARRQTYTEQSLSANWCCPTNGQPCTRRYVPAKWCRSADGQPCTRRYAPAKWRRPTNGQPCTRWYAPAKWRRSADGQPCTGRYASVKWGCPAGSAGRKLVSEPYAAVFRFGCPAPSTAEWRAAFAGWDNACETGTADCLLAACCLHPAGCTFAILHRQRCMALSNG